MAHHAEARSALVLDHLLHAVRGHVDDGYLCRCGQDLLHRFGLVEGEEQFAVAHNAIASVRVVVALGVRGEVDFLDDRHGGGVDDDELSAATGGHGVSLRLAGEDDLHHVGRSGEGQLRHGFFREAPCLAQGVLIERLLALLSIHGAGLHVDVVAKLLNEEVSGRQLDGAFEVGLQALLEVFEGGDVKRIVHVCRKGIMVHRLLRRRVRSGLGIGLWRWGVVLAA